MTYQIHFLNKGTYNYMIVYNFCTIQAGWAFLLKKGNYMKKIFTLFVVAIFALSFVGCNKKEAASEVENTPTVEVTEVVDAD
jgi:hypothetical protein